MTDVVGNPFDGFIKVYNGYLDQVGCSRDVNASTVWIPVQCGFQCSMDSSAVWIPVQCGCSRILADVGVRAAWAITHTPPTNT